MDLKTLTEINAPSGHEQAIRRFLLDELKKLGFAPVLDRMGNVVVVKEGTGDAPRKRVMVSAHMDEVGLIVTSATEDGYLRIAAAGGIDPRVLVSKPSLAMPLSDTSKRHALIKAETNTSFYADVPLMNSFPLRLYTSWSGTS